MNNIKEEEKKFRILNICLIIVCPKKIDLYKYINN